MRIGVVQSNPLTGALRKNAAALLAGVRETASLGAELCIAPEMALCGHNAGDLLLREEFIRACRSELGRLAEALHAASLPPLLLGAPLANPAPAGKPVQNCAVLLDKGRATVIGRKVILPAEGIHDDCRYFEPGLACGVLYHKGWRFAVTVGEDIWTDRSVCGDKRGSTSDPVAEFMAAGGADGLLNLTALPYAKGLPETHLNVLKRVASQYRLPALAVNMAGGNDSFVYYGGSMAFADSGTPLAVLPYFKECSAVVDLAAPVPPPAETRPPLLPIEEELRRAAVCGIRDFARKCGFTKAALGLSGGIDSALVALLAAEALGPGNVTGLLMPSPYSSAGSVDDSLALAENLGIQTRTLPISPLLCAAEETFSSVFPQGLAGLPEENVQARIRGMLLMAHSNRSGDLILATGNKSEFAVGYSTLYGDTVGGLAPIGDLYKTEVYALCRHCNAERGDIIPREILEKAPSAELRPNQQDSDSLPPYDILDAILKDHLESGMGPERLAENGHAPETAAQVIRLVRRAEFKRRQAPPVLRFSTRGFGGEWRMPVAASDSSPAGEECAL